MKTKVCFKEEKDAARESPLLKDADELIDDRLRKHSMPSKSSTGSKTERLKNENRESRTHAREEANYALEAIANAIRAQWYLKKRSKSEQKRRPEPTLET